MPVENDSRDATGLPPVDRLVTAIRLLALAGLLVAAKLWYLAVASQGQPGCSGSGDCSVIWQSRWANWFGLPVSALACATYGAFLAASWMAVSQRFQESGRKLIGSLSAGLVVIALWFVILQGAVLKHWCRLCLTSHVLGLLLAVVGFVWLKKLARQEGGRAWFPGRAVVAGFCLALAGLALHTLSAKRTSDEFYFRAIRGEIAVQRHSAEVIQVYRHTINLKQDGVPMSGNLDAPEVLVVMFDYTCPDCRRLHGQLRHVLASRPGRYLEISIPAPLNPKCNPTVTVNNPMHTDACELARIGVVVAQNSPRFFPLFHDWMMTGAEPPAIEAAKKRAVELVGAAAFERGMADPASLRPIKLGADIFKSNLEELGLDGLPLIFNSQGTIIGASDQLDDLLPYMP